MSDITSPAFTPGPATEIDTNAEYIQSQVAKKEPSVLYSVSKYIVVETIKDFFGSIWNFIMRYIKHFIRCLVYFYHPSLRKKPFSQMDFKENAQHAFEFVIIISALLIFLIKVEWIPPSDTQLLEFYNHDIMEKFVEVLLFFLLAIVYIVFSAISILAGRLFRKIYRIQISTKESDILYIYLNNAFFSFAAIVAMSIRSVASLQTHDEESIGEFVTTIGLIVALIPMVLWCIRYARLTHMTLVKGLLFFVMVFPVQALLYGLFTAAAAMFIIGV